MLSIHDNETICRVGPGTPMGNLMRQYWVPAFMSSELPANDCPPLRVLLLGERLIAYRDTSGNVGLFAESCPHRGASMFFGRNEENGLRCVYHGWKFDVTGACVDMPSEPAESNFRNKVRIRAYPTRERCGMVWTYMGPRSLDNLPPLPLMEGNMQPEGGWRVQAMQSECNYLQVLEGDIDTVHFGFLHRGSVDPDNLPPWSSDVDRYAFKDRAPRYKLVNTEIGVMYGAYRPAEEDSYYWRIAHFLLPFYTMPPGGGGGITARIPMDDNHTMSYQMSPSSRNIGAGGFVPLEAAAADPDYARVKSPMLPNTTDWYGRWRPGSNLANDFEIDREMQQRNRGNNGYTGIVGNFQDMAITTSMGPIYARHQEHLGSSDAMIIRTRSCLLRAVREFEATGAPPAGVENPEYYLRRSATCVLPREADWIEATAERRRSQVKLEAAAPLATA
jgi:phenylpropionate dioxygenase-like ring-hydroxylating dioxygenase large terminal subunit